MSIEIRRFQSIGLRNWGSNRAEDVVVYVLHRTRPLFTTTRQVSGPTLHNQYAHGQAGMKRSQSATEHRSAAAFVDTAAVSLNTTRPTTSSGRRFRTNDWQSATYQRVFFEYDVYMMVSCFKIVKLTSSVRSLYCCDLNVRFVCCS